MTPGDLDAVVAIESAVYSHPWTRGNFNDSLSAGYQCWIVDIRGAIAGYSVAMIAAAEAHLLNLSVAAQWQRLGLGSELLQFNINRARDLGAGRIFLEVRPSNSAALALYRRAGFAAIGVRRAYYPDAANREDAVVMELSLR